MRDIPTFVPTSFAERVGVWWEESWFDSLWQLLVVVAAVGAAAALVSFGGVGVILGFLIVAFMFREPIHDALSDIWDRDFWRL